MSYDLQIFSCSEPNSELARLATEEGFERGENIFFLRGKHWQLIFHSADKVEPEDIPVSVFRELPGIGYDKLTAMRYPVIWPFSEPFEKLRSDYRYVLIFSPR